MTKRRRIIPTADPVRPNSVWMQMRAATFEHETTMSTDRIVAITLGEWFDERAEHMRRVRELDDQIVRLIEAWAK